MSDLNLNSKEFCFLFEKARGEIEECVRELINDKTTPDRAAFLRGRIASCRASLELDQARLEKLSINPFYI